MASTLVEHPLTRWLRNANTFWFTLYASVAVFCLYTCIFAFRKAFTAATFEGLVFAGISYKVWLVIAQVLGYALSKFIGIKIIAELKAHSRTFGILLMTGLASGSWLLFALVPPPYNIVFIFTNGFPLGMVWGMVFGYLEGRRTTEVLTAALSVSFIFSGGLSRSTGAFIMRDWHVSEMWMPLVACLLFAVPMLTFLWLVDKLPPPSPLDEALRTRRQPMDGAERKRFVRTFLPGIILFTLTYILLTTFRDFRDNFSAEVWKTLGYGQSASIFTATEVPVSIAVLIIIGSIMLIRNNALALMINHLIIAAGMILIAISTYLFEQNTISAPTWMILIGLGLYLGYVPFNSIFFDRLIATFRYAGTVGFIMYIADSFGYLGSISVLFFKEFGYAEVSWLHVFIQSGYIISLSGAVLILASMLYFRSKFAGWENR
ncbi:hypothetical protein KK062_29070 [Fulvivirgaceae bacterium PWU5]|uniref:MFS transporter n=2 Tax=Dawidia cretensis TaxID=2782350 RepID=A0AAP2E4B3_9BACT|nr:hypothetical protein [Dawidia cretensis]